MDALIFIYLFPVVILLLFFFSYYQDRRKLLNGLLFNLFLGSTAVVLALFLVQNIDRNQVYWVLMMVLLIPFALVFLFGIYALVIFLFWNARVVLKREGRSFQNLLTLLLGIMISFWQIFNFFSPEHFFPEWVNILLTFIPIMTFYFVCVFLNYISASFVYSLYKPRRNQDYIIILGSGLINGHIVPPLLANRINKGLNYYWRFRNQGGQPKIIFSGGKGSDEALSEAEAMYKYAVEQGMAPEDGIMEDQSVNTYQNMLFSKQIIESQMNGQKYRCMFVTNYFHVFRAAMFTKMVDLQANGVGAATRFYYVPNAILREFVAIVMMKKKRHVLVAVLVLLFLLLWIWGKYSIVK